MPPSDILCCDPCNLGTEPKCGISFRPWPSGHAEAYHDAARKTPFIMGGVRPLTLLICLVLLGCSRPQNTDVIEFRSQSFKMKRAYATYEDYKDDPDNLAPGEAARASQAVRSAPIGPKFESRMEMLRAVF